MHRTETTTLTLAAPGVRPKTFKVSAAVAKRVEALVSKAEDDDVLIPAEVVSPILADDARRPGAMVRGSRYKEEMTQVELAKRLGIRQSHLSEMENAKRPIGKEMAKRLGEVFRTNYKVFL
ncbi:MAG TPA: helix-turn-helix transcriptional regulator [Candidatus Acidoferrum sp.]|nr:helix-turn-helix transcriptional regulator [Candidatus Acidoferrum sp.]